MNWHKFPYTLIITTIYVAIGMFSDIWDKTAVIFMTIPIYYMLVSALNDSSRKDHKNAHSDKD